VRLASDARDGGWPSAHVDLFRRWVAAGYLGDEDRSVASMRFANVFARVGTAIADTIGEQAC
jgi:hypothetical protein